MAELDVVPLIVREGNDDFNARWEREHRSFCTRECGCQLTTISGFVAILMSTLLICNYISPCNIVVNARLVSCTQMDEFGKASVVYTYLDRNGKNHTGKTELDILCTPDFNNTVLRGCYAISRDDDFHVGDTRVIFLEPLHLKAVIVTLSVSVVLCLFFSCCWCLGSIGNGRRTE